MNLPLRWRLLLIVGLALLPAVAVTIWSAIEAANDARAAGERDCAVVVERVANRLELLAATTRQLLEDLADDPAIRAGTAADGRARLARVLTLYPTYLNISTATPDGEPIASALPYTPPFNIADRAYFRQALQTGQFSAGTYIVGRVTHRATINFALPVKDAQGQIKMILQAAVDIRILNELFKVPQPPHVLVLATDRDGTILYRSTDAAQWVGKADTPDALAKMSQSPQGSDIGQGVDKIQRVRFWRQVRLPGATVPYAFLRAGVEKATLYAPARARLWRNLALLFAATLASLLVAWKLGERLLTQGIARLVKALDRMAAGDLAVRSGMTDGHDEISRLGRGFDQMAQQVQEREDRLRKARDEAQAANRAKDHFLAAASHEMRTPLTPVLLLASQLGRDTSLPPAVREDLDTIRRNIEIEKRLIGDLLDFSAIHAGKLTLRRVPTDLHEPLQAAIAVFAEEAAAKRLHLDVQLQATCGPILGDPDRLRQVFWNLLQNAIKFTPVDGTITIRTRNEKTVQGPVASSQNGPGQAPPTTERRQLDTGHRTLETLVIEVSDNGAGIDPPTLAKVFAPFEQGPRQFTQHTGGLGLGLAIAKALVEAHGGTITAQSPGLGHGATFLVRLPVSPVPAAADGTSACPVPPLRRLRLLVVEDHLPTLNVLSRLLQADGHQVVTATTLAEAREAVARTPLDVVLSDLGLPDGSGLDLMPFLRDARHLPGIALTGYGADADREASRLAGFREHLTKPVSVETLRAVLARVAATPAENPGAAAR